MKTNKSRLFILFSLSVFTLSVLFASCELFAPPETKLTPAPGTTSRSVSLSELNRVFDDELDRREELLLLYLEESYEISEQELQDMVLEILAADDAAASGSAGSITGVYEFSVPVENGFSSVPANRRMETDEKESSEIPFYVFYIENPSTSDSGFVFCSGDARIGNLLAFVPNGNFHDTDNPFWQVFLSRLDSFIFDTIEIYNSITDQDIAAATARRETEGTRVTWNGYNFEAPIVSPLLTTEWDQDGTQSNPAPYNRIINKMAGNANENLWPAGCVAVAMSQIAAYWERPHSPPSQIRKPTSRGKNDPLGPYKFGFNDPYNSNNPALFSDITYDWNGMKYQLNPYGNLILDPSGNPIPVPDANDLTDTNKMRVGVLMLEMGYRVDMNYGSGGSTAYSEDVPAAFKAMGYTSSDLGSYNTQAIKTSLDNSRPVYISGQKAKNEGGHAWTIDGYRFATKGSTTYVFVHCNAGWGGSDNGWYRSQLYFDMNPGGYLPGKGKPFVYQYNIQIIPNIRPLTIVTGQDIPGVIPPVEGDMPATHITPTDEYTGKITWNPPVDPNIGFVFAWYYTATITLSAQPGYTFIGVPADYFHVAGADTTANSADSKVVIAQFGWTPRAITSGVISGVTPPVPGSVAATTISETSQIKGNVSWAPPLASGGKFAGGTTYTATINLEAKPHWTLQNVIANYFTVMGTSPAATNPAGSGVITAKFPKTLNTVSVSAIKGVPVPTAGIAPVTYIADSGQYSGNIFWDPEIYKYTHFAANTSYTATIYLAPYNGYTFSGVSADYFTLTGGIASNAENDGVVTVTFPATGICTGCLDPFCSGNCGLLGFGGGDGSEDYPYRIMNVQQLRNISNFDDYSSTTYFKLVNNIDMQGANWMPLDELHGSFDGDGYTILSMYVDQALYSSAVGRKGLFAENSGTIKNLHVTGRIGVGQLERAGLIAGINNGVIKNCTSNSYTRRDMIFIFQHTASYSGGITGYNTGTVQNCANYGNMQGMGHAGGVVGYNEYGTVLLSSNSGYIEGSYNTGGVVGYNVYGTVSRSYNSGTVSGVNDYIGGVVGRNLSGVVSQSYNTASVSGGDYVGGIVGANSYSTLVNSYNSGEIFGSNCIGGIAGSAGIGEVGNCVSLGKAVSGTADIFRVGPIDIIYSNKARDDMIIPNNGIWDGEDVSIGTPLSTVFNGWNTGIWDIPGGSLSVNGALPILLDMPPGTQNPTLQP